jgi:hypothetical protein
VLFVAVRGHGVHQLPLIVTVTSSQPRPQPPSATSGSMLDITPHCHMRLNTPRLALHELSLLSFFESFEKAHAALDTNRTRRGASVRAARWTYTYGLAS